jgi:hypothetical protein
MFAILSCRPTESITSSCEENIGLLLKYGADPFYMSKNGFSAEMLAESEAYKDYVSDGIRARIRWLKLR